MQALQPSEGAISGKYLPSRVNEIHWGWLPNASTATVLEVGQGELITIDTVSHEGLLADQGRDPKSYLAQWSVKEVLQDAIDIAASDIAHDSDAGPHVVTGPIHVSGAKVGDLLKIEIVDLAFRVPYGFVSNRHGRGALVGEFPEDMESLATRDIDQLVSNGNVSHFAWVDESDGKTLGRMSAGKGRTVQFPLNPFLGMMGVASNTQAPVHSVPPGDHGGNIDIKHAGVGSTLYLPVLVEGANFFTGDPHFAQGNGEVALTAFEASLRATLKLSVVPQNKIGEVTGGLVNPMVETATHWIPMGMDPDLNEAMRIAVRNSVAFLNEKFDVPRSVALAYLSAAGDFEVSQVVDAVKGVHCMISKADWAAWT
jgi:acetamidase/formamidase